MSSLNEPGDALTFAAETPAPANHLPNWRVLIVDDDDAVHQATQLAFDSYSFAGRGVEFYSAFSGTEARALLASSEPFACVLLDVVMESEHAGLELVHHIRRERQDHALRIILRTGQPGRAPEVGVVRDYDINDYREKDRSTRAHLHTALTSALRSYQQIMAMQENRRGLEMVNAASASLLSRQDLHGFASGILTQMAALIQARPEGIVYVRREAKAGQGEERLELMAAAGTFMQRMFEPEAAGGDPHTEAQVRAVLSERASRFDEQVSYLYLPATKLGEIVVVVKSDEPLREIDRKLLELFGANIAVGIDNSYAYRQMERLACYDPLTGLPNLGSLERMIDERMDPEFSYMLAFADIDQLGSINHALGRGIGDQVLRYVGSLLDGMPEVELVARVGGDVFALAFAELGGVGGGGEAALQRIQARLNHQARIDGHVLQLQTHIGAVRFQAGQRRAADLCAEARMAMAAAKHSHAKTPLIYEDSLTQALNARLALLARLRGAAEGGELRLMYQPQMCLRSGRPLGVEALLRWRDGEQLRLPAEFLPLADRAGLAPVLGRWVIGEALRQQQAWRAAGLALRMSVNVSVRQLLEDEGLLDFVQAQLGSTQGVPADLEFDVAEASLQAADPAVLALLGRLRALGIGVAIDDFGSGATPLGRLRDLPATRLKLDQGFVQGLTGDSPADRDVAELVLDIGRRLGLAVLAEGVESEAQAQALSAMACGEAQGFFYARPLWPDELQALLQRA